MAIGRQLRPRLLSLPVFALTIGLVGCVTPVDVKTASRGQLELLSTLDGAVGDLQQSLDQWHQDREELIRQEGRVLIARQAMAAAIPPNQENKAITADHLFVSYDRHVRPWVDYAFLLPAIGEQLTTLTERLETTSDPILKGALTNDLEDLRLLQAQIQAKPQPVREIEAIIQDDLSEEQRTATDVHDKLEVLRAQIALMKVMATKVDAWLAIDVTVTQEQVDGLQNAFVAAQKALGGSKQ
jgi:hypothetical protein